MAMSDLTQGIAAVAASVIGLATLAVVLSKNAQTSGVISAAGSAFSGVIGAAVAPVSGGSSFTGIGSGGAYAINSLGNLSGAANSFSNLFGSDQQIANDFAS